MEGKRNKVLSKARPYTKDEVNIILEEVDSKLYDFIKSDKYKDVLLTMGNLGKYSFLNQMYILLQKPDATCVNTMKQWNWHGRSINPGEKSIKILSPIKKFEDKEIVDENGQNVLDSEGNKMTKKVSMVTGFKPTYVFDLSQTHGREFNVFKYKSENVKDKDLIISGISQVVGKKGYSIEYADKETLGEGCYGSCNHMTKKIKLLEGMDDVQTISTLVHEAGHALAHSEYRRDFEGLKPNEKTQIKEVEAESIACVVCSYLGLDTENFNFSYISGWSDGDISKFRKNVSIIGNYSNQLINGIDDEFTKNKIAAYKKNKLEQAEVTDLNECECEV